MDASTHLDLTTTSVGRVTIVTSFESFFANVKYSGSFRVIVTIDRAYSVEETERSETLDYLAGLPGRFPNVSEVVLEDFPRHVGLTGSLSVLFAHCRAPVGVHLEDDWEITGEIDLDNLMVDLGRFDSTAIVFSNEHVARGGTFERPDEVTAVGGSGGRLLRLVRTSWAKAYLPLCPHLHRSDRWQPTIARALALTDDVRCPDERVRERLIAEDTWRSHNVLWTSRVVARDLGREWLARRGLYKAITPQHNSGQRSAADHLPRASYGPLQLERSGLLRRQAEALIPGVTQTFHKRPANFADGAYPVYLERGDGALVWDADGNSYLDYLCALGAATLGHNHPVVSNTIRERAGRGVLLSLPAPAEIQVSELLVAAVPGVEMVRFLKTGAEACSAAVRLARAHTGRSRVLLAGYHGWHDQLGGGGPGVPTVVAELSPRVSLNSASDERALVRTVHEQGSGLAAVVLSTPYHRELTVEFLGELRSACEVGGVLLVLDEVVTGFRIAPGGLGQALGIPADLLVFSKGLAAGMPLAAVAGPERIMEGLAELHVSTTFGGELMSLEVAKAALREYARGNYYQHIARLGARLRDGFNEQARRAGLPESLMVGYEPMPSLVLEPGLVRPLLANMAARGVLLRRDVNFISAAHTEAQIDFTIAAAGEALTKIVGQR